MFLSHIPFGGMMKQGSGNLSCLSLNYGCRAAAIVRSGR